MSPLRWCLPPGRCRFWRHVVPAWLERTRCPAGWSDISWWLRNTPHIEMRFCVKIRCLQGLFHFPRTFWNLDLRPSVRNWALLDPDLVPADFELHQLIGVCFESGQSGPSCSESSSYLALSWMSECQCSLGQGLSPGANLAFQLKPLDFRSEPFQFSGSAPFIAANLQS